MAELDKEKGTVQVPIVWVDIDEEPIVFANHFLCVHSPEDDQFILAVGQMMPPPFIGTEEERLEQAKRLESVTITTVSRLSISEPTMRRLIEILESVMRLRKEQRGEG